MKNYVGTYYASGTGVIYKKKKMKEKKNQQPNRTKPWKGLFKPAPRYQVIVYRLFILTL